ncbi:MAG: CBS domain-containing protein [Candidatus Bathyarchaeota archaeon]|nr:CBS domain-containing protein [Candidatus Bathyarchaeota archaeon]
MRQAVKEEAIYVLECDHTLRQAYRIMVDVREYAVTVTKEDEPIGVITINDILDAVRRGCHTSLCLEELLK